MDTPGEPVDSLTASSDGGFTHVTWAQTAEVHKLDGGMLAVTLFDGSIHDMSEQAFLVMLAEATSVNASDPHADSNPGKPSRRA